MAPSGPLGATHHGRAVPRSLTVGSGSPRWDLGGLGPLFGHPRSGLRGCAHSDQEGPPRLTQRVRDHHRGRAIPADVPGQWHVVLSSTPTAAWRDRLLTQANAPATAALSILLEGTTLFFMSATRSASSWRRSGPSIGCGRRRTRGLGEPYTPTSSSALHRRPRRWFPRRTTRDRVRHPGHVEHCSPVTVAVGGELEVATLPLGPIVTSPTPAQVSSQRWSTRSSEARGEDWIRSIATRRASRRRSVDERGECTVSSLQLDSASRRSVGGGKA